MRVKQTEVQLVFEKHMRELGLECTPEVAFCAHRGRKWKADWMVEGPGTSPTVLVECEGGAFTQGRHTRGKGFIADMEKYNNAALEGHYVLRFTPQQILKGEAKAFIAQFFVGLKEKL